MVLEELKRKLWAISLHRSQPVYVVKSHLGQRVLGIILQYQLVPFFLSDHHWVSTGLPTSTSPGIYHLWKCTSLHFKTVPLKLFEWSSVAITYVARHSQRSDIYIDMVILFLYILTSIWNGINCLCLSTWITLSVYNYLWNFVKLQVLFWFYCNCVLDIFAWRGFDASVTEVNPLTRENNDVSVLIESHFAPKYACWIFVHSMEWFHPNKETMPAVNFTHWLQ